MPDTSIARTFYELGNWLQRNNVGKLSLHVIVNIGDPDEAMRFDSALRRDLDQADWLATDQRTPNDLEIMGIKVKVETPFT